MFYMALSCVVYDTGLFNVKKYREFEIQVTNQWRSLKWYYSIDWVWIPI